MAWFKVKHGFSSNPKMGRIARDLSVPRAIINAIAIDLIEYMSRHHGVLEGYDYADAAFNLGIEEVTVRDASLALHTVTSNFELHQASNDPTHAARQARYRDKQKQKVAPVVTEVTRHATVSDAEESRVEEEVITDVITPTNNMRGKRLLAELGVDAKQVSVIIPVEYAAEAIEMGIPMPLINSAWQNFVDYWRAVPGKGGVKLDWPATWRNSLRRIHGGTNEKHQRPNASRHPNKTERARDAASRALIELGVKPGE